MLKRKRDYDNASKPMLSVTETSKIQAKWGLPSTQICMASGATFPSPMTTCSASYSREFVSCNGSWCNLSWASILSLLMESVLITTTAIVSQKLARHAIRAPMDASFPWLFWSLKWLFCCSNDIDQCHRFTSCPLHTVHEITASWQCCPCCTTNFLGCVAGPGAIKFWTT